MAPRMFKLTAGVALVFAFAWLYWSRGGIAPVPRSMVVVHSALATESEARTILDTTQRHREWINVPLAPSGLRVFAVYPGRADNAPVVLVTAKTQTATPWMRAVAVRVADEGYIAVVPDLLSGMAPNGGDGDSFPDSVTIAGALERMGSREIARRTESARAYAISLPAANGKSASLVLDTEAHRIQVAGPRGPVGRFALDTAGWREAAAFLAIETDNHPVAGTNPKLAEDHSSHFGMMMAQTAPVANRGGEAMGYPRRKLPQLPAGVFTARSTLLHSKLRKEFADIPMGNVKLHTWVEYPDGEGKVPIAIVMQHGPGMDDWQRALADQLALEGFLAIAVDLHSGLGPSGGNYESFQGTDEVMRATARLTPEEMQRRYRAGMEWGKKLPRANGKIVSIGFCMGGGNSFRFAAEVPELNAAVSYYGATPSDELLARIKAPVLAFYGEDDARVTAAAEPTKAAMQKLGKSFEYHVYPHATHGFLEFQDLAGNPAATTDSWSRTIAFLREHTR